MLSVRFPGIKDTYVTALLGIDEKSNTLILDYGPKEDLNQRMLSDAKVAFDTDFRGVKVAFPGTGLKKTTYQGESAFSMAIPKSLYWMQRRDFYRVKVPRTKPGHCQIMLNAAQLALTGKKLVDLKLDDISLTGFAMFNDSKESAISELFNPGGSIENCKFMLPEAGDFVISFQVCGKYVLNAGKLNETQKIGCKFIGMTRPVEEIVQRYMLHIQRLGLQREGGE